MSLDHRLAAPMFWTSVLFLVLTAGALHLTGRTESFDLSDEGAETVHITSAATPDVPHLRAASATAGTACLYGLALLYPLFLAESLLHWRRGTARRRQLVWCCLVPPLRIGARDHAVGTAMWLPFAGWADVNDALRQRVERAASVPMLVVALMVLPLLAAEHFFESQINGSDALTTLTQVAAGLIWLAFCFEFIVMISLSDHKLRYVRQHWLDLVIICLPLIAFLRAARLGRLLRVGRAGRLQQLAKTLRVFRMKGTAMRLWRAILLLRVVDRLIGGTPEKRLDKLREQLALKEREMADLRREIESLEANIPRSSAA